MMHRIREMLKKKIESDRQLKQQFIAGRTQGILSVIADIARYEDKNFAAYLIQKWNITAEDLNLLDEYAVQDVLPLLYQNRCTEEYVRKSIAVTPHIINPAQIFHLGKG